MTPPLLTMRLKKRMRTTLLSTSSTPVIVSIKLMSSRIHEKSNDRKRVASETIEIMKSGLDNLKSVNNEFSPPFSLILDIVSSFVMTYGWL